MTDETGKETEAETTAADEAAEPIDPVAELQDENARLKDQLLRTLADMENLRKRTSKELREARDYAVANFARDMLTVGDNLRRALDAVDAEARAAAEPSLTGLLEGVEMTEREMHKLTEKHGVRKIEPEGERFDPNLHQAMFEVPNPDVANGTVVEVIQTGYVIGERMLRPAMVGIAKGGPKMPRPAAVPETDAPTEKAPQAEDQPQPQQPGSTVDKTA